MYRVTHFVVVSLNLESTDLERVTVKSLDEIKREKEQKRRTESATSTSTAHATRSHDTTQADGSAEDTVKDNNIFGKFSIAYRHCISHFMLKRGGF